MNDVLSAIWDFVIIIVFACVRGAAICYGFIGVAAQHTEFIVTGILLYLVSNTCEKIIDERLER